MYKFNVWKADVFKPAFCHVLGIQLFLRLIQGPSGHLRLLPQVSIVSLHFLGLNVAKNTPTTNPAIRAAAMNGFAEHGLDDEAFGENKAISAVKAFDAFPKTKPSYKTQTSTGGVWTVVLVLVSFLLSVSELRRWYVGNTTHLFSVEKGVSHDLQINLDVVLAMKCDDIHINVQDASGDRILAGQALQRGPTTWGQWGGSKAGHALGASKSERKNAGREKGGEYEEEDVHDYLGAARRQRKFAKTPKLPRGVEADACRVFGSLEGNKVQGDFHITARGHGYMEFGQHLDHKCTDQQSHHLYT